MPSHLNEQSGQSRFAGSAPCTKLGSQKVVRLSRRSMSVKRNYCQPHFRVVPSFDAALQSIPIAWFGNLRHACLDHRNDAVQKAERSIKANSHCMADRSLIVSGAVCHSVPVRGLLWASQPPMKNPPSSSRQSQAATGACIAVNAWISAPLRVFRPAGRTGRAISPSLTHFQPLNSFSLASQNPMRGRFSAAERLPVDLPVTLSCADNRLSKLTTTLDSDPATKGPPL